MNLMRASVGLLVVTCATMLLGCQPASKPEPTKAENKSATAKGKTPVDMKPATHPDCVGSIGPGIKRDFEVAGVKWSLNGSTLKQVSPSDGKLVLGTVTDIKENTDDNLKNLKAFVAWFKSNKVDAVVVAGDSGMNKEQIQSSLEVLAGAGVPVFSVIGNREGRADYRAALAAVSAKHPHVVDMNTVRRVDTPDADIVSMPGYYNASYIHADDGCAYSPADVAALEPIIKSADSPVVLVSHGGPKQAGAEGLDRTAEGENVGDPALAALLQKTKVPFGIFGNIHEAGGRGTDLAGSQVLAQKTAHAGLFVNPGPADGVRWVMNDKTESVGMAALMTITDGKASYEVHRLSEGK